MDREPKKLVEGILDPWRRGRTREWRKVVEEGWECPVLLLRGRVVVSRRDESIPFSGWRVSYKGHPSLALTGHEPERVESRARWENKGKLSSEQRGGDRRSSFFFSLQAHLFMFRFYRKDTR